MLAGEHCLELPLGYIGASYRRVKTFGVGQLHPSSWGFIVELLQHFVVGFVQRITVGRVVVVAFTGSFVVATSSVEVRIAIVLE